MKRYALVGLMTVFASACARTPTAKDIRTDYVGVWTQTQATGTDFAGVSMVEVASDFQVHRLVTGETWDRLAALNVARGSEGTLKETFEKLKAEGKSDEDSQRGAEEAALKTEGQVQQVLLAQKKLKSEAFSALSAAQGQVRFEFNGVEVKIGSIRKVTDASGEIVDCADATSLHVESKEEGTATYCRFSDEVIADRIMSQILLEQKIVIQAMDSATPPTQESFVSDDRAQELLEAGHPYQTRFVNSVNGLELQVLFITGPDTVEVGTLPAPPIVTK